MPDCVFEGWSDGVNDDIGDHCRKAHRDEHARLAHVEGLLKLYRIKFAVSDAGSWDAHAHLAVKTTLLALGEPGMTFAEATEAARDVRVHEAPRA